MEKGGLGMNKSLNPDNLQSNFTFKPIHRGSSKLQKVNYLHFFIDTFLRNDLFFYVI